MGNNSKASNSKLAKHINIRYYLLTDKTEKDKLSIKWCPTVDMIVYFMKKPTPVGRCHITSNLLNILTY